MLLPFRYWLGFSHQEKLLNASDITLSLFLSAAELSLLLREMILKLFSEHLSADGKVMSSMDADSLNAFMCARVWFMTARLCMKLYIQWAGYLFHIYAHRQSKGLHMLTLCVFVQRPFIYEKLSVCVCSPCSHSLWTT